VVPILKINEGTTCDNKLSQSTSANPAEPEEKARRKKNHPTRNASWKIARKRTASEPLYLTRYE